MTYRKEEVYMMDCDETTIMIIGISDNDEWEIYYRRPHYAFQYVFGLPYWKHNIGEAFEIAMSNIKQYRHIFD